MFAFLLLLLIYCICVKRINMSLYHNYLRKKKHGIIIYSHYLWPQWSRVRIFFFVPSRLCFFYLIFVI